MTVSDKKEFSYGIIPLECVKRKWQVLLVQHRAGHWSFPKGHVEAGEQPQQAAVRELQEETGLSVVSLLPIPPLVEHYFFTFRGALIDKTVTYFPAIVKGRVSIQEAELQSSGWFSLAEAKDKITFKEGKTLIQDLETQLEVIHPK